MSDRDAWRGTGLAVVTFLAILGSLLLPVAPGSARSAGWEEVLNPTRGPIDLSTDPRNARVVVGYEDLPAARSALASAGAEEIRLDQRLGFLVADSPTPSSLASTLRGDTGVRFVYVEERVQVALGTSETQRPDDPLYGSQYGPQHVNASGAWETTRGSDEIDICIVDSGVRYTHEDLQAHWEGGVDFYSGDTDPMDSDDHGTHIAGIAAAAIGNGRGIAGLANVGILGVRVFANGGYESDMASGIGWCAGHGAEIINLSFHASENRVMKDAIRYARSQGSLLVAASGNHCDVQNQRNCVVFPARDPRVVSVQNVNVTHDPQGNPGENLELSAPGEEILSTGSGSDRSYLLASGTSMAAPHVAGVAALAWSANPNLSAPQVREILQETAVDLGEPGRDSDFGFGLVDAGTAVRQAQETDPRPIRRVQVYNESFDASPPEGWNLTGLWRIDSLCSQTTTAKAPGEPEREAVLAYNLGPEAVDAAGPAGASTCTYRTGYALEGTARFSVDLSNASQGILTFDHRIDVEETHRRTDLMLVEISRDGGGTWEQLARWDAYHSSDSYKERKEPLDVRPLPVQERWFPIGLSFRPALEGPTLLQFRFDPVDPLYNEGTGWMLDDVTVTGEFRR